MSLDVLLVLATILLGVGVFAVMKRRAVLAAVTLPLSLLAGGVWLGETVGVINV